MTPLIILIVIGFFINIGLAWSCARSESRVDNIENTLLNVLDWCNNRNIKPPYIIPSDEIDKHAIYTILRGCFWLCLWVSIITTDIGWASVFLASVNALVLIGFFKGAHGFWYIHYANKLNKNAYKGGWKSNSGGSTAWGDRKIKDNFAKRVVFVSVSTLVLLFEIIGVLCLK